MKKTKTLYILIAVIILSVSLLCIPSLADAGFFSGGSDYGGSDFGGGYSDYGGGSSGGYYYFGSSSGSGGGGAASAIAVIVILVVAFLIYKSRMKHAPQGKTPVNIPAQKRTDLRSMSSLTEKDPNFSEAVMKEKISNLYVRMQNAWQDKNFEPMRPYMTDALYNQFSRQLEELVRSNRTNYIERIAVLGVTLDGWTQDDTNDAIVATVNTRITDYTLDDKTEKLVSGSKTAEKFMCYEWALIRSSGMVTPAPAEGGREGTVEISCPSCGAPVEINQSAKCPYCGSIINAKDYDWSLSAVKGISQRTAGK